MEYLLSLVVPIYNKQAYLSRMIDSIVMQKISNVEIILVDDGSTDDSGMICDLYARKYGNIKVFHIENNGCSNARNVGKANANGKYISFPDPDDYYLQNSLLQVAKMLDECDAVFFDWVEERGGMVESRRKKFIENRNLKEMDWLYLVVHPWEGYRGYLWNKIFKTELVKDIDFDNRFSHCEDLLWICEVYKRIHSINLLDILGYCHVFYEDSLSHFTEITEKHLAVFEAREEIIRKIDKGSMAVDIAKMAYYWEYLNFLKKEVMSKNDKGVDLVNTCYNKEYEKVYYSMVSIKARLQAKLLNKMAKKDGGYTFAALFYKMI